MADSTAPPPAGPVELPVPAERTALPPHTQDQRPALQHCAWGHQSHRQKCKNHGTKKTAERTLVYSVRAETKRQSVRQALFAPSWRRQIQALTLSECQQRTCKSGGSLHFTVTNKFEGVSEFTNSEDRLEMYVWTCVCIYVCVCVCILIMIRFYNKLMVFDWQLQ